MDIADTIAPKSDQMDAIDLAPGPRIFTITGVKVTGGEQPVHISLAEFDRPWRPGKTVRRILVAAWGPSSAEYVGRRLRLFCDDTVVFGGAPVGGIRVTHLSHLDRTKTVVGLISTRGKSGSAAIEPLTDDVLIDTLRAEWRSATPERQRAIEAEVASLTSSKSSGATNQAKKDVQPTATVAPEQDTEALDQAAGDALFEGGE